MRALYVSEAHAPLENSSLNGLLGVQWRHSSCAKTYSNSENVACLTLQEMEPIASWRSPFLRTVRIPSTHLARCLMQRCNPHSLRSDNMTECVGKFSLVRIYNSSIQWVMRYRPPLRKFLLRVYGVQLHANPSSVISYCRHYLKGFWILPQISSNGRETPDLSHTLLASQVEET